MPASIVSGHTEVLAILGDPIRQVRTPALVNAEIARRGLDAVLVPLQVSESGLGEAVAGLRRSGNVRGAVVTMPHKQRVTALVQRLSSGARRIGACNVIRFAPDRTVHGENTDGHALVSALTAAGVCPAGADVFLAGAGGAGSSIGFALAGAGVSRLAIHNRNHARAEELADNIRAQHPGIAVEVCGPDPKQARIVVNATSVGLHPGLRELPFKPEITMADAVVDIVISPRPTALVEAARRQGITVVDGEDMLRAQVAAFVDFMLGVPSTSPNHHRPAGQKG
jgi:shikimate dehydrogenase